MTRHSMISGALAMGALVLGCAPGPALEEAAVIGGEVDPGHPAVGMLSGPTTRCTGTLVVDSCTVLTAAHCAFAGAYRWFYVGGERHEVVAAAVHPSYDRGGEYVDVAASEGGPAEDIWTPVADVAILRLAPPCSSIEPMPIASSLVGTQEPIWPVGYGLTDLQPAPASGGQLAAGGGDGGGTRLPSGTRDPSAGADLPDKLVGENSVALSTPAMFTYEGVAEDEATTCFGDSGGPTLRLRPDGAEEIVGVHATADCLAGSSVNAGWRASKDLQAAPFADFAADPSVCEPGARLGCEDAPCTERVCDVDGMWPLDCGPSQEPACRQ